MTSLSGEFHTDLALPDALAECAEAIHGLGWPIESVEGDRAIFHAGSPAENPPRIEVVLAETGDGTEIRITGSDTEANPLEEAELVAALSRVRDALSGSRLDGSLHRPEDETKPPSSSARATRLDRAKHVACA